jgi:hypothetical protein
MFPSVVPLSVPWRTRIIRIPRAKSLDISAEAERKRAHECAWI